MDIAQRIQRLEDLCESVPGTQICRVMYDTKLLENEGIITKTDRASVLVWSVALGGMQQPKCLFVGLTIEDAIRKAEQALLV